MRRHGLAGELRDPARPVTAHRRHTPAGHGVAPHAHPRAQLLLILSGVMRIEAGPDTWIVPPGHAAWIPGGLVHEVGGETEMAHCNIHFDPAIAAQARPEAQCVVLQASALLREMAARLAEPGPLGSAEPPWQRLGLALVDEVARLAVSDLGLPGGHDPRLRRVTRHLMTHPAEPRGLPDLAAQAGSTERTLARLFPAETGMTFRQWRTRQRMLLAMERLERGESSGEVAAALGYGSASAFIAAFRRAMGAAPGQILRGG